MYESSMADFEASGKKLALKTFIIQADLLDVADAMVNLKSSHRDDSLKKYEMMRSKNGKNFACQKSVAGKGERDTGHEVSGR